MTPLNLRTIYLLAVIRRGTSALQRRLLLATAGARSRLWSGSDRGTRRARIRTGVRCRAPSECRGMPERRSPIRGQQAPSTPGSRRTPIDEDRLRIGDEHGRRQQRRLAEAELCTPG